MAGYDAFLSYNSNDKAVAAALQAVVQRLGKPWYRRRALRIFRDGTSLSATPGLWPSIEQALNQSRFLILLASPQAGASPWVNKEVTYWLEHKSIDTLLIAVTDGELAWDNALGDFRWRDAMPLPPVLTGRFPVEPKWVDLRPYRVGADARDSRFIELGADFAAAIHGTPKEDLLSQEVRQQRRALTLASSAAASLLVLVALAGWQWRLAVEAQRTAIEQRNEAQRQRDRAVEAERVATEQKGIAEAQRARAERTLATATQAANALVFELAQEFRNRTGMPVDLVRGILERAQALQRQLSDSGETSPELRRSEYAALDELVTTLLAQGDTQAAFAAAARAVAIMEALVASDPADAGFQNDLAVSYERIADVMMAQGRREEALVSYRKSLAIAEKLAADPTNADAQHGLSISYNKIGDVLSELRQHQEALDLYRKSLAIVEKLVAADPGNAERQRDLALGHEEIGDALVADGKREEALGAFRKSLAIREKLAAADPANAQWQRDLSISYNKIGDALIAAFRREDALDAYGKSLAIREKLAAADPGNAQWQADMAISLFRLAMAGDDTRARLTRALDILRKLDAAGKLTADQKGWIALFEGKLAALAP